VRNTDWDSLTILNAIAVIDECYAVTVEARTLAQCTNFGEILALVKRTLAQTSGSPVDD